MSSVEAVGSGIVTCYLSKMQMTALLRQAEEEGLTRQQIVKRAVVELLIEEGKLDEFEAQRVAMKQRELAHSPQANKKEVSDLRVARTMTEQEKEREGRNNKLRRDLARLNSGLPLVKEEVETTPSKPKRRPRRNRTVAKSRGE